MSSQVYLLDGTMRQALPRDPLTGHREELWRVDLLNNQDVAVSQLIGVTGGIYDFDISAVITGSGNLVYQGPPIDWNQHRIQPWYRAEAGGQVMEWPLGVFLVATPSTQYQDGGEEYQLVLYDKALLLDQTHLGSTFVAEIGQNIIGLVRNLLAGAGQTRTAIVDSGQTVATPTAYDTQNSVLTIINELLKSANYTPLRVDGDGVFRTQPHLPESERGMSWAFKDDSKGIYLPEFTHDFDTFNIPNRVRLTGRSSGPWAAPTATATDTGNGPFSYATRGNRWVDYSESATDADSLDTLQALAKRKLVELQDVGSEYTIEHLPIPLEVGSIVSFERSLRNVNVRATVQKISYSMDAGSLCTTTLREYAA